MVVNSDNKGSCKFGERLRIKKGDDFRLVFADKCSVADSKLIIYGRANQLGYSRLGLAVGRKLGGAVVRNRYKRVLREDFRLSRNYLPVGYDYVIIPRSCERPSGGMYQKSLRYLAERLEKRIKKRGENNAPD